MHGILIPPGIPLSTLHAFDDVEDTGGLEDDRTKLTRKRKNSENHNHTFTLVSQIQRVKFSLFSKFYFDLQHQKENY